MNHQNIELIEGQKMKFILTISNESDLTNYEIEGYTKGFSVCNCSVKEFEVIEVNNNTVTLLTPSLSAGSHGYQLYLTNINTNQQFKVAEGRIDVTANYSHETHLSERYATIEATIHSDSIEMTMTIDKGMQGDKGEKGDQGEKGEKGDKGDTGLSAYEIAQNHGYSGSEQSWVEELQGAAAAATEAKNAAAEAKGEKQISKNYANTSQRYASEAESSKNYAENYYNSTVKQYEYAETAASAALESEIQARQLVAEANTLITTANNTIQNAAIKNANNTFSGTNTFNNITKLTVAPNSLTSVVNEEASLLLDFVQQAGIRTVESSLTQKVGSSTQVESTKQITVTFLKDNSLSLWEGTLYPFQTGNYFSWSAIWIPTYTNINRRTSSATECKFRFIPSFSTNLSKATEAGALNDKLLKQVTDISKPFVNYTNINTTYHCAVAEILCEIENKRLKWTIYSPVDSGGMVQQVKVISFTTTSGGQNYANDTGFLFVNEGSNKAKIFFRDFNSGYYRWIYCGEVFMRVSMTVGSNYATKIIYAGVGGYIDCHMVLPKEISFLPQWNSAGQFTNCQQILQAVTPPDMTETIITLDEYKTLQA